MNNQEQLYDRVSQLGSFLQAECLKRAPTLYVKGSIKDRKAFRSPPLCTSLTLNQVPLQELVTGYYSNMASLHDVVAVWDQCPGVIEGSSRVATSLARHLGQVHPHVHFTPQGRRDAHSLLAQFLYVSSLSQAFTSSFDVSKVEAGLSRRDLVLSVGPRIFMTSKGSRRFFPGPFQLSKALRIQLGPEVVATPRASAAFRLAITTLPELVNEIDFLFAVAVAAGREFEHELARHFDVEIVNVDKDQEKSPWVAARRLVDFSMTNPRAELHSTLADLVERRVLIQKFGNPNAPPLGYTQQARDKHRKALEALEAGAVGTKARTVSDLLEIQNLLKS